MGRVVFFITFVVALGASTHARAASIHQRILSSTELAAIDGGGLAASDFVLTWEGAPLTGVTWRIDADSLEWVRVDGFSYPRGRAVINATGDGGTVSQGEHHHPLSRRAPDSVETVVGLALITSGDSQVRIHVARDGKIVEGKLSLKFVGTTRRLARDPTCSPFRADLEAEEGGNPGWIYLGCRLEGLTSEGEPSTRLRLSLIWDGVGDSIDIDGVPTMSAWPASWLVSAGPESSSISLRAGGKTLSLRYEIPSRLRAGWVGLGIGPYTYSYMANGATSPDSIRLMPTLYASLKLTPGFRLVTFQMATFGKNAMADAGVYLNFTYLRMLDNRITLNLMLGAHAIGFDTVAGNFRLTNDFAQGAEVVFTDFLSRGKNLSLGAFVYPEIRGVYYNNFWLRWGPRQLFIELNLVDWKRPLDGIDYSARALGLTLGFSLFSFL